MFLAFIVTMVKKSKVKGRKVGKLVVKKKFAKAVRGLNRLPAKSQRAAVAQANSNFIKDLSSTLQKLRKRPQLLSPAQKKNLARHKAKLRKLVSSKTSIKKKREILIKKGGIIPFLIPIICAAIGGASTIAASAAGAAIARS